MDETWLEIEEATKDFDFETIKSKAMSLPDDQGKALEPIKNIRGLMKSFIDAQKMIGDPSNRLPKDGDQEGWEKFYQKIGKPESPDQYQFNLPEYELPEDILEPVTKSLHEANLTNKQAEKVLKTFLDLTKSDMEKSQAEQEKQLEEFTKQKQVKFGDKLGETENLAKSLLDKVESESVKSNLQELMKSAEGLEFLSQIASKTTGDNPAGPSNKQPPRGAKTAKEQIEVLKADKQFLNKIFGNDMSIPLAERQNARKLWEDLHYTAAQEK
jgi:hypothetical protein